MQTYIKDLLKNSSKERTQLFIQQLKLWLADAYTPEQRSFLNAALLEAQMQYNVKQFTINSLN